MPRTTSSAASTTDRSCRCPDVVLAGAETVGIIRSVQGRGPARGTEAGASVRPMRRFGLFLVLTGLLFGPAPTASAVTSAMTTSMTATMTSAASVRMRPPRPPATCSRARSTRSACTETHPARSGTRSPYAGRWWRPATTCGRSGPECTGRSTGLDRSLWIPLPVCGGMARICGEACGFVGASCRPPPGPRRTLPTSPPLAEGRGSDRNEDPHDEATRRVGPVTGTAGSEDRFGGPGVTVSGRAEGPLVLIPPGALHHFRPSLGPWS